MKELKLTTVEKRSLEQGIAIRSIRLKAGRIFWDELEKQDLISSPIKEDKAAAFKKEVLKRRWSEIAALKEWLNTQIEYLEESPALDLLGSNEETCNKMLETYKKHLELLCNLF
ncbi:MAG TPA: hypothetical protein DIC64_00135 [Alphaproteobacteria bacterium]|nr:hypothetical protein [Alphaproteobacteria bacterium]